jgi:transcriptional regulator with XRE-family HTH domain
MKYQNSSNGISLSVVYNTQGGECNMFEEDFSRRLSQLREQKGVSARDMSLSIGQNAGYINSIENGKALPSMAVFLGMCDYLGVSPSEFFDTDSRTPERLRSVVAGLKRLNEEQLQSIEVIVNGLLK